MDVKRGRPSRCTFPGICAVSLMAPPNAEDRCSLRILRADFTLGPFSHAALVMEKTFLLEATGEGTGHTMLLCARLEYPTASHPARRLHLLPTSTTRASVLRRGELKDVTVARLMELSNPFLWQQYPALASTVTVFDSPEMTRAVLRAGLQEVPDAVTCLILRQRSTK